MKTGIELITDERKEQIEKHGRSVNADVATNDKYQLVDAATKLAVDDTGGYWPIEQCPIGWDQNIWDKMTKKNYKDRLVIAGALIAAEIDRINNTTA
jgi:hypothetical protein